MHPRRLRLAALLLWLTAVPASAAPGLTLSWNQCFGEAGAVPNKSFACDTNAGTSLIEGTFELASPMAIVIGAEIQVNLASASPTLPPWWQLYYSGACRQNSLAWVGIPNPADVICTDWAQGLSAGGLGGYCTTANPAPACPSFNPSPNFVRIPIVSAVAPQNAQDLAAGQRYFDFGLRMNNLATVGTGSCGGCSTPVCIVFNSAKVVARDNVEIRDITTSSEPGSNFITWQAGGPPVPAPAFGCPAATPTHRMAWGAVKQLYR